jgi:hypothetical protein
MVESPLPVDGGSPMHGRLSVLPILISIAVLISCASHAPVSNRDVIDAAKAELTQVRSGLDQYRAEHDVYPATSMISSHEDLMRTLTPYIALPPVRKAAWGYISYVSVRPDTFVLRGFCHDENRTLITLTSLTSIPSDPPPMSASDRARIGAARAELATVKNGLGMYQAESDDAAYPPSSAITRYDDLRDLLSPYFRMPDMQDAAWSFVSYARAKPDTFVLTGKARDSRHTLVRVTPTGIYPW